MIPNMYKIAGELTPCVIHVAARSLAAHALSIFGDHQDVMSVRGVGFAMLASNSVQEVMDMALISQAASMESRVPFVHFFDGFRTSHEVAKVQALAKEDLQAMISDELVQAHRKRGLTPDRPMLRGTAQNPDVYFQGRETVNPFYLAVPTIVQNTMDKFARLVGRKYELFQYSGAPDAERVIILPARAPKLPKRPLKQWSRRAKRSGSSRSASIGHSRRSISWALPATTKSIAVLDRTKEPGSLGEPMYQDVLTVLAEAQAGGTLKFGPCRR